MRVIVDVDGTIVDFHRPLHKLLRQLYPEIPAGLATDWDWYFNYITKKQFYAACTVVHKIQMQSHSPIDGVNNLFNTLNQAGAEIIVASHRQQDMAPDLARWLANYNIEPYSGVYTGENKHPLITPGSIVIDDAPHTIKYARDIGAHALFLRWPWNRGCDGGSKNLWALADEMSLLL